MWKYVSRRIRDTFERSVNQFNTRGSAGVVNSPGNFTEDKNTQTGPPCRWFSSRKCWSSFRCGDDTNSDNKWNFEHLNKTWIGAITWSSALVLGWYTSQLIHFKLKCNSKRQNDYCCNHKSLLASLYPYISSVNEKALNTNSASNIEKLIENVTPTVCLISNEQSGVSSGTAGDSTGDSATLDNSNVIGDVLNVIENSLGIAAIKNGQHKDGLNLLRSAASHHYAPALFNLGLCYESGLGVSVDEKMAMEMYKSAAAMQHPKALYNLGIYYGQGRGGLQPNPETATRLLRLAAVQGQKDAIDALKALNEDTETVTNDNIVPTQTTLFVDNVNFHQSPNSEAIVY